MTSFGTEGNEVKNLVFDSYTPKILRYAQNGKGK